MTEHSPAPAEPEFRRQGLAQQLITAETDEIAAMAQHLGTIRG